jgi:hypothetical protein
MMEVEKNRQRKVDMLVAVNRIRQRLRGDDVSDASNASPKVQIESLL